MARRSRESLHTLRERISAVMELNLRSRSEYLEQLAALRRSVRGLKIWGTGS